MLSFLAAVLYPLLNKIDMVFRRAGAMRCNCIFLHHRGTSKEIIGGGRRGNFSFGLLVSYSCSFWLADRTLAELYWVKSEMHKAASKFSHHFCSECVQLMVFFRNCLHKVKSSQVQLGYSCYYWLEGGTGINALLLTVRVEPWSSTMLEARTEKIDQQVWLTQTLAVLKLLAECTVGFS